MYDLRDEKVGWLYKAKRFGASKSPAWQAYLAQGHCDEFGRKVLTLTFGKKRTEQEAIAQCNQWLAHVKKMKGESAGIAKPASKNTECTTSEAKEQPQKTTSKSNRMDPTTFGKGKGSMSALKAGPAQAMHIDNMMDHSRQSKIKNQPNTHLEHVKREEKNAPGSANNEGQTKKIKKHPNGYAMLEKMQHSTSQIQLPQGQCDEHKYSFLEDNVPSTVANMHTDQDTIAQYKKWLAHIKKGQRDSVGFQKTTTIAQASRTKDPCMFDTDYVQRLILTEARFTDTTNSKIIKGWLKNKMAQEGIVNRQEAIKKAVENLESCGILTVKATLKQKGRKTLDITKNTSHQIQQNEAAVEILQKLNVSMLHFKYIWTRWAKKKWRKLLNKQNNACKKEKGVMR